MHKWESVVEKSIFKFICTICKTWSNPLHVERSDSWLKYKLFVFESIDLDLQPYVTRENSLQTSFQVGDNLKKGQKLGRDELTQEDYPTSARSTQEM